MRRFYNSRPKQGFSLVELVVAIVLLGILGAMGSTMLSNSFTTTRLVNDSQASQAEARYVMERLMREIRELKYLQAGYYCIDTMTASRLVFDKRSNNLSLDKDSCSTATNRVTINYSAPDLTLSYATPALSATLTNRVALGGFALSYFESDGTTLASSGASVYFVDIALTLNDATGEPGIVQRARVALRNS